MPVLYAKFRTDANYYVYDTSSNHIFQVSAAVWSLIDDYLARRDRGRPCQSPTGAGQDANAARDIEDALGAGHFASTEITSMRFYNDPDMLSTRVQSRISQLTLEVTQGCNSRCTYCPYSQDESRFAKADAMRTDTALRAVDVFMAHSYDAPSRTISFWGGEPLLNDPLIRSVVDYVQTAYPGLLVHYSLTTNGTLITREAAAFFAQHLFTLLVSLDGPAHIHDRCRIDSNRQGTFDRTMRSLALLSALDPEYYRRHVHFNCVLTPGVDIRVVAAFLATEPLCSGHTATISTAALPPALAAVHGSFSKTDRALYRRAVYGALSSGNNSRTSPLAAAGVRRMFQVAARDRGPIGDAVGLNGCCVPLLKKMHVTVDGAIHVCEKVEPDSPVGHVHRGGIDMRAVERLVSEYSDNALADCRRCWAVRLCVACYRLFIRAGRWANAGRPELCEDLRRARLDALADYAEILEANPRAFDHLKDAKPILPI